MGSNPSLTPPPPPGYSAADVVPAQAAAAVPPPPPGYSAADVVPAGAERPAAVGMGDLRNAESIQKAQITPGTVAGNAKWRLDKDRQERRQDSSNRLKAYGIEQPADFAPDLGPERYGKLDQIREVTTAGIPLGELARANRGVRSPVISQYGESGADLLGIGKRFQNPPGTPVKPPNVLERTGETLGDIGGGLGSPENLLLLGAMEAKAPAAIAKAAEVARTGAGTVFRGQMGLGAAQKGAQTLDRLQQGDVGGAYQSALEAGASGLMAAPEALHGPMEAARGFAERRRAGKTPAETAEQAAPHPTPDVTAPQAPVPGSEPLSIRPEEVASQAPPQAPPPPAVDRSALDRIAAERRLRQEPPPPVQGPPVPTEPRTLDEVQIPERRAPNRGVRPDTAGLELPELDEQGNVKPPPAPPEPPPAAPPAEPEQIAPSEKAESVRPPEPPPGYAPEDVVAAPAEPAAAPAARPAPEISHRQRLPFTTAELKAVESAGKAKGAVSFGDLPPELAAKIREHDSLHSWADWVQNAKGTVGRHRTEMGDGTFKWQGEKSVLSPAMQKYEKGYSELASIVRRGLAGKKLLGQSNEIFDLAVRENLTKGGLGEGDTDARAMERFLAQNKLGGVNAELRDKGPDRRGATPPPEAFDAMPEHDRREAYRRTYDQARTDELTNLRNTRAYREHQAAFPDWHEARVDLDEFKRINDVGGHPLGDEALKIVGSYLRDVPGAATFRSGGDEFSLRGEDPASLERHLKSLQQHFDENVTVRAELEDGSTEDLPLRLSYGLGPDETSADQAAYADKNRRRDERTAAREAASGHVGDRGLQAPESGREVPADGEGRPGGVEPADARPAPPPEAVEPPSSGDPRDGWRRSAEIPSRQEDWGNGRGQGKRSGGTVRGAMSDAPRGVKTYRDYERAPGVTPEIWKQVRLLEDEQKAEAIGGIQAGVPFDEVMRRVYGQGEPAAEAPPAPSEPTQAEQIRAANERAWEARRAAAAKPYGERDPRERRLAEEAGRMADPAKQPGYVPPTMDELRSVREGPQPIEELSPEASEKQRRLEELAAEPKKKPAPGAYQSSLDLYQSEDRGRAMDQTDLFGKGNVNDARPIENHGGGQATGDFGKVYRNPGARIDKSGRPTTGGGGRKNMAMAPPNAGARVGPVERFLEDDVKPAAKSALRSVGTLKDDLHTALSPATKGEAAKIGGGTLRQKMAERALKEQRANAAIDEARQFFDRRIRDVGGKAALLEFSKPFETGGKIQDPRMQAFADTLREMLDERVDQVRALGTGKLQKVIENYFPHVWKDVKSAEEWLSGRSLEGGKSFMKKRTIPTTEEGIAAGLEPVSWNPAELALIKLREMDKYVMAHEWLKESEGQGTVQYFPVDRELPAGWTKIDDKIGTVYGSSRIPLEETVDGRLMGQLEDLAADLGVRHRRETGIGGPAGAQFGGRDTVLTKFASPMGVLTHELGHAMDEKFSLWDRVTGLRSTAKGEKAASLRERKAINEELRALAALRHEGMTPQETGSGYQDYIRSRPEKIANLIDAYVNHRSRMRDVAPTVLKRLEQIIGAQPELAPLEGMRPSMVMETRGGSVDAGGTVIRGHYAAPEELARIVNRHLSPGLENNSAFKAWRAAGNSLNQAQLGLSMFHAGMTSLDAVVSKVALGYRQIGDGKILQGVRSIATAPAAPIVNVIRGNRAFKEALGNGPLTGDVELALKGGARFGQDSVYHNNIVDAMRKAYRQGNYVGAGLRVPAALVEATAIPLMKWLVPRQKLGSFLDLAHYEVGRLGPDATLEQTRHALGRAQDSIDNRMGQLVYDNLFWNRTAKDLLMASIRSLGWNVGTVRELGGAVYDAATITKRLKEAREGKLTDPVLTNRMAYAMALTSVVGTMGAMTTYLLTGKGPQETKDYFFPRTGRKNDDGTDERVSFPSYVKDVAAFKEQGPVKTIANKLHPLIGLMNDLRENKDFHKTEIRHEDDPVFEQLKELAGYVAKQALPLSIRNFQDADKNGDGTATKVAGFFGVTRAPKYLTSSPASKAMAAYFAQHSPSASRTAEEAEARDTKRDAERALRGGEKDKAKELLRGGLQKGTIGEGDLEDVESGIQGTALQTRFRRLPLEEKFKVMAVANESERKELVPALRLAAEKAFDSGSLDKMPRLKRDRIMRRLREMKTMLYPAGETPDSKEVDVE